MTLLWLSACLPEFDDPTLLDELRVMTLVSIPPEVQPGQLVAIDAFVADPQARGFDLLMWTCVDLGEGCDPELTQWRTPPVVNGDGTWVLTVPNQLAGQLGSTEVPVSVFALACEIGLCPPIDDALDGVLDLSSLSDPVALAQGLPLQGTSLVRRTVLVTETATPLNENPRVRDVPPWTAYTDVAPGQGTDLDFWVSDDTNVTAEAYTTAGSMSASQWTGHALTFTWTAPEQAADAELWVVLEDGQGGAAVWRAAGTVVQ